LRIATIEPASLSLPPVAATVLTATFVVGGCVAAAFAVYLLALSIASFFYREVPIGRPARSKLLVLVPAHNESLLIARCVRSLCAQEYSRDLYEVLVVADNCTDDTAAVAAAAGAHRVLRRDQPQAHGKGQAIRWALDRILWSDSQPDAVVIVDADSVASPGLLQALAQRLEAGERVVQATYLLSTGEHESPSLSAISFMLVNSVRPAGLTVLRLPAIHLTGNGMLFARDLLLEQPWTAFTSTEDIEYGLILHASGERIAFAREALIEAPPAPNPQAAEHQRLRWHGGKIHLARRWLPPLLTRAIRERRPSLLSAAFGLALPPLGLLTAAVLAGSAFGAAAILAGLMPVWVLAPWLLALASIPAHVIVGLRAAGAPRSAYVSLIHAPLYILHTAFRAHRVWRFHGSTWVRTEREPSSSTVRSQP
jgi:cellulose synthase/poly-beta-1,6-N-acetylglucosamine synthase-like glycosyltransferase